MSRAYLYKYFRSSEPTVRKQGDGDNRFENSDLEWTKLLNHFEYEPLSAPACIRILTIEPDKDFDAPVSVKLQEADLNASEDSLSYVALSHAWGPTPVPDRILICNGARLGITGRIDYALRRIRRKAQEDDYSHWCRIWIDAICIDQTVSLDAKTEKAKQVEMMHKIFGSAREVIVDLGKAFRLSHMLPSSVDSFEALGMPPLDDGSAFADIIVGVLTISFGEEEAEEGEKFVQTLSAVGRLFQREWFVRIWTLQEVALSRNLSYMVGGEILRGDYVERLADLFLMGHGEVSRAMSLGMIALMGLNVMNGLQKVRLSIDIKKQRATSPSWKFSLPKACVHSGLFESTDPRDFLYCKWSLYMPHNQGCSPSASADALM